MPGDVYVNRGTGTTAGSGSYVLGGQGATLTPASNAITITDTFHKVNAGSFATINGGKANQFFVLEAAGAFTVASGGNVKGFTGTVPIDSSVVGYFDGTNYFISASVSGGFVKITGDTMTGALGVIAGSVSAPSIFASGDTNTGPYWPAADQFAIATAGVQRMLVDASGFLTHKGGASFDAEDVAWTFDAANLRRAGIVKQQGFDTELRYLSSTQFRIRRITHASNILDTAGSTIPFEITTAGLVKIPNLVATAVAPTVAAGEIAYGATTQTTVGAAGAASALPANPTGYIILNVAGTARVIAFYNAS